ncbi:MAG: hypothetical protein RMK43_00120 [Cyclobacteriaceae bacterium]|nr:hypothetical protein [Cyclobacteriaceae bacterium]
MRRARSLVLRIFLSLLIFFAALFFALLAPVNTDLPREQPFYESMMHRIDSAMSLFASSDTSVIRMGFAKASITPSRQVATAGYVKRKGARFTSVRDSVFVRVLTLRKETTQVSVVSFDMLIVPPLLFHRLRHELSSTSFPVESVFFGATHTHNSIGQWDDHLVGEIYAGEFDGQLMDFLVEQTKEALLNSVANLRKAKLRYSRVPVKEAVRNRLIQDGPVDSLLHLLVAERDDGSKVALTSYPAHATCLSSTDLRLSADYPGELVRQLESNGYAFAMFLAGAVGSHAPAPMPDGDEKIAFMGNTLFNSVRQTVTEPLDGKRLFMHRIPMLLGQQQIRVSTNWRVRPWVSSRLLGDPNAAFTVLQIGNLVIIGTPCDFSGMLTPQLYARAQELGLHLLVTSFNGGYIGYITPDKYYTRDAYETQIMNWYGPGNGSYLSDCIIRIINQIKN